MFNPDSVNTFLRVAPQLGGVVTLIGLVIFAFFGLLKILLQKGIIVSPPQKESAGLLHKVLNYAFWISVIVIVLGFVVLILPKIIPPPSDKHPKLSLSFANRDEAKAIFRNTPLGQPARALPDQAVPVEMGDYSEATITSPTLHRFVEIQEEFSFDDLSPNPQKKRNTWTAAHGWEFFPYVVNLGQKEAKGVWFKLYVPKSLSIMAILPMDMDMADDEENKRSVLFSTAKDIHIRPRQAYNPIAQLPFDFLPLPEKYIFPFEVGATNSETFVGELTIEVDTKKVRPEFVENAPGLRTRANQELFESVKHFENAVKLNPHVGAFRFNLAVALLDINGQEMPSEQAIAEAKYARDLEPKEWRTNDLYGAVLADGKRLDEAEAVIMHMVEAKLPPYHARSKLLQCLAKENKREANIRGVRVLERIVAVFPDDATALSDLGGFYVLIENFEAAEKVLKRSKELNPDDEVTAFNLKQLSEKRGTGTVPTAGASK